MNIIERIKSNEPIFFKKIIKISIAIGGIGASIIALPLTVNIVIPTILITIANYMVACGCVGAAIGKLSSENEGV